jgi:hypothetical protein
MQANRILQGYHELASSYVTPLHSPGNRTSSARGTTNSARQRAALNFQTLVLGQIMRYAEVTIAYRQHAGAFPKFAKFNKDRNLWIVGTVNDQNVWTDKQPEETFPDKPT